MPKSEPRSARPRRPWRTLRNVAVVTLAAAIGLVTVQHLRAQPDREAMEPARMGQLEADMWRYYYEHRWLRLGATAMQVACSQYRFSWWDGARLSFHAARAAKHFRADTDDPRCLPALERYYEIIRRGLDGEFDPAEAARLELLWWKERRWKVPPEDYARTIARLTSLIHGASQEDLLPGATVRAQAMAYRDARRDGTLTTEDWEHIARELTLAYTFPFPTEPRYGQ